MKIILAIMCGLVALFAGGCALMLLVQAPAALPSALIPSAILALNLLVLLGMFGRGGVQAWAFYLLAVVDLLAALAIFLMWTGFGSQMAEAAWIAVPAIVLLAKAVLTVLVVRRLPQ